MSALDAKTRPVPALSEKTPHVRHTYHRCTRDTLPRVAWCGHQSGPVFGVPFNPKLPDLCQVCLDLRDRRCPLCGEW